MFDLPLNMNHDNSDTNKLINFNRLFMSIQVKKNVCKRAAHSLKRQKKKKLTASIPYQTLLTLTDL